MGSNGTWRATSPWTGWAAYGVFFFLSFIASFFYAWGIIQMMNTYVETSSTKNTFSFGDELVLLVGIVLWGSAYNDVLRENDKLRLARAVVAQHLAVMKAIIQALRTSSQGIKPTDKMRITMFKMNMSQEYTYQEALCETCLMLVMSPIIFLWESTTSRDYTGEGADLLRNFNNSEFNPVGTRNMIQEYVRNMRDGSRAQTMGMIMVDAIQERLIQLDMGKGLIWMKVGSHMASMQKTCSDFEILRDCNQWMLISVFNIILGVLYLLAAPLLLWFGQGWFTLAVYPMVYLFVGGQLTYRWFISDIFYRPTDWYIQLIYDDITSLASHADNEIQKLAPQLNIRYSSITSSYNLSPYNAQIKSY